MHSQYRPNRKSACIERQHGAFLPYVQGISIIGGNRNYDNLFLCVYLLKKDRGDRLFSLERQDKVEIVSSILRFIADFASMQFHYLTHKKKSVPGAVFVAHVLTSESGLK